MFTLRHLAFPVALCTVLCVVGCENMHPNSIPPQAMLSTEGNGLITATAPRDGTVYVYDVGADRLVYSGAVTKGQVVTVNTNDNRIVVDNQARSEHTLNTWNKHRVYFDNTPLMDQGGNFVGLLSLAGPLGADSLQAGLWLASLHAVVASVVVGGLHRRRACA